MTTGKALPRLARGVEQALAEVGLEGRVVWHLPGTTLVLVLKERGASEDCVAIKLWGHERSERDSAQAMTEWEMSRQPVLRSSGVFHMLEKVEVCGSTLSTFAAPALANLEDVVRPLGERLRGDDADDADAARRELDALALGVALSLTYAVVLLDAHSIAHRDIKPSNVLVLKRADGSFHALLADHGIACTVGTGGAAGELAWWPADYFMPTHDASGAYAGCRELFDAEASPINDASLDLWAVWRVVFWVASGGCLPPQVDLGQVRAAGATYEALCHAQAAAAMAQLVHTSLLGASGISEQALANAHGLAAAAAEEAASRAAAAAASAGQVSGCIADLAEEAALHARDAANAAITAREHAAAVALLARGACSQQSAADGASSSSSSAPPAIMPVVSAEAEAAIALQMQLFWQSATQGYKERCGAFHHQGGWLAAIIAGGFSAPLQDVLLRTLGSSRAHRMQLLAVASHPYLLGSVDSFDAQLPLIAEQLQASGQRARLAAIRVQQVLTEHSVYDRGFGVLLAADDGSNSSSSDSHGRIAGASLPSPTSGGRASGSASASAVAAATGSTAALVQPSPAMPCAAAAHAPAGGSLSSSACSIEAPAAEEAAGATAPDSSSGSISNAASSWSGCDAAPADALVVVRVCSLPPNQQQPSPAKAARERRSSDANADLALEADVGPKRSICGFNGSSSIGLQESAALSTPAPPLVAPPGCIAAAAVAAAVAAAAVCGHGAVASQQAAMLAAMAVMASGGMGQQPGGQADAADALLRVCRRSPSPKACIPAGSSSGGSYADVRAPCQLPESAGAASDSNSSSMAKGQAAAAAPNLAAAVAVGLAVSPAAALLLCDSASAAQQVLTMLAACAVLRAHVYGVTAAGSTGDNTPAQVQQPEEEQQPRQPRRWRRAVHWAGRGVVGVVRRVVCRRHT